ncbi:MAG: fluoride efflux transporter CrcB [Robiginitomaculum sp.]|nr:MAG: fluoride efflux transporter CrcB [Robiginitomaculum sp.]
MNGLIYVALGGAIGASCRYLLGGVVFRAMGPGFPWGTLAANVIGGLLMGLLVGWLAFRVSGGENLRLFLAVGVLGGFTTFSSFSLEALRMIETKAYGLATGYMSASVVLSVLAVFIGLMMARKLFVL